MSQNSVQRIANRSYFLGEGHAIQSNELDFGLFGGFDDTYLTTSGSRINWRELEDMEDGD